jgi:DNA-directed RNA polymerase specialized sigma24 family protein
MATVREVKSPEELANAVRDLSSSDKARLRQLALGMSYLGPLEPEDLLQEAVARGIAGTRTWPQDISLIKFLAMTMRSILDIEIKKARRRPQALEGDEDATEDLEDLNPQGPGRRSDDILINNQERAHLLALFKNDDVAQLMVEGMLDNMEGEELRDFVGLTPTEFASKRRKIRRTMNAACKVRKNNG